MALLAKDRKDESIPDLIRDTGFRHIAFIMDGNGRWAKKRGLPREFGHKVGSDTFKKICIYWSTLSLQKTGNAPVTRWTPSYPSWMPSWMS